MVYCIMRLASMRNHERNNNTSQKEGKGVTDNKGCDITIKSGSVCQVENKPRDLIKLRSAE